MQDQTMKRVQVYLDESGHSSTHPVLVVAGYMALSSEWLEFEHEWSEVLANADVRHDDGSVGVFHMKDFEDRRRAFGGWTDARRHELLFTLFEVINRRNLYAVGFGVSVDWWKSCDWAATAPRHVPLSDVYHWAAQGAVETALRLTNEQEAPDLLHPADVAFTFAEQVEFGGTEPKKRTDLTRGTAATLLTAMGKFLSSQCSVTVNFDRPNNCAALQAADIVAFELRRRLMRPDLFRWPLRQIVNSRRVCFDVQPPALDAAIAELGGEATYVPHSDRVQKVRPDIRRRD